MTTSEIHQHQYQPSEYYARKVFSYSKLDPSDAYFSGLHYNRLGKFLVSAYKTYGGESQSSEPENGFPFVTLSDLSKERDVPARTNFFCQPDELTRFLKQLEPNETCEAGAENSNRLSHGSNDVLNGTPEANTHQIRPKPKSSGIILFLRGFPSPQWLNLLGAELHVDPELFSRHLEISTASVPDALRLDTSYLTPFPKTRDLIQLRVCNTGAWSPTRSDLTLAALRESCEASMSVHLSNFMRSRDINVGDSIVRRFMLHNLYSFSIEQRISIEVIYHTRTWSSKSTSINPRKSKY